MILAGLLSGIITGLVSAILVALSGFGVLLALLAYVISGSIGMVMILAIMLWRQGRSAELHTAEV